MHKVGNVKRKLNMGRQNYVYGQEPFQKDRIDGKLQATGREGRVELSL